MPPIRRLLLAVDLEPRGDGLTSGSRLALEQARQLAVASDAEVTLFHSTLADEAWDPGRGDYVLTPDGLPDTGRRALDSALESLRDAGLSADLVLSNERAWLAIVRRALHIPTDLVVAGKRGEAEGGGHRIGSVAMKLLRKCPCPVWVAKPGVAAAPRRVLAACDLTPVGDRVIELAASIAGLFDAALEIVHSFQMPLDVQWHGDAAEEAAFEKQEHDARRARLETSVTASGFGGAVTYAVGRTSPTRAVLACQERFDPDLVVMGTVSRGGIAGLLVGNTAERLLGRLDCSLLTVKPEDFVCPVGLP